MNFKDEGNWKVLDVVSCGRTICSPLRPYLLLRKVILLTCEGKCHHGQAGSCGDEGEPEEDFPLEGSKLSDMIQDLVIVQSLQSSFVPGVFTWRLHDHCSSVCPDFVKVVPLRAGWLVPGSLGN